MINFADLKIKSKLRLLAIVPLLALIVLVAILSYGDYKKTIAMEKLGAAVDISTSITTLVHETQKERGATAGFLSSGGKKFADKLPVQRENTDKKITVLKEKLNSFNKTNYPLKYQNQLESAIGSLSKIEEIGTQVTSQSIKAKQAIAYYTKMNGQFLDTITILASISDDATISNKISAYSNFLLAKERAGIERAVGSAAFAQDKFTYKGMREKFSSLITAQDTYTNTFKKLASQENLNYLNKTLQAKSVEDVQAMRDIALNATQVGGFGIDPNVWFAKITQKINKLKAVDDYIAKNLPKHQLNTLNQRISALVHETQKERCINIQIGHKS